MHRPAPRLTRSILAFVLLLGAVAASPDESTLPYPDMAAHIVRALQPSSGERAMVRFDSGVMPGLEAEVEKGLEARGVEVELLAYGPADGFAERLEKTDIYIWLPRIPSGNPADQTAALGRWLDAGRGRQIHFHWGEGTRGADGTIGEHSPVWDAIYLAALDIDYAALDRRQRSAGELLRSGPVRVTTPDGTDLVFRVGERPFTRQYGDASKATTAKARVRTGREIELPSGVLRVAPLEESVNGTMVLPRVRFGGVTVEGLRLEITAGRVTKLTAEHGVEAARKALDASPVLGRFREFGLGFNPELHTPPGESWVTYYGYGAGMVRLSLGDNSELGGAVRGGAVRWFFFPRATVAVDETILVRDGRLVAAP